MKMITALAAAALLFNSCGESVDPTKTYELQASDKFDKMSWIQYLKYCDETNSFAAANFKKIYDAAPQVVWQGQAFRSETTERSVYSGGWIDEELYILMEPCRSKLMGDIHLYLTPACKAELAKIRIDRLEGDVVEFTATPHSLGFGVTPHLFVCNSIKKISPAKPKEAPKLVPRSSVR